MVIKHTPLIIRKDKTKTTTHKARIAEIETPILTLSSEEMLVSGQKSIVIIARKMINPKLSRIINVKSKMAHLFS